MQTSRHVVLRNVLANTTLPAKGLVKANLDTTSLVQVLQLTELEHR